eukprot:scaffold111495_cov72-Phaeocystis_antarctica.AAC.6
MRSLRGQDGHRAMPAFAGRAVMEQVCREYRHSPRVCVQRVAAPTQPQRDGGVLLSSRHPWRAGRCSRPVRYCHQDNTLSCREPKKSCTEGHEATIMKRSQLTKSVTPTAKLLLTALACALPLWSRVYLSWHQDTPIYPVRSPTPAPTSPRRDDRLSSSCRLLPALGFIVTSQNTHPPAR